MPPDDASDRELENTERFSLSELTEAAAVSVRTVRYYIAEGLLPPPEGAGPGSAYTQEHLDRLRLIQRLKEAYLPLKEIRRRLSGLSDDDVREFLAEDDFRVPENALAESEAPYDASLAGARDYLALLESRERYRTEPMALHVQSAPVTPARPEPSSGIEPARSRGPSAANVAPARKPPERDQRAASSVPGLWHRIPLGDEAELVISDRVYDRHRERVDWLVRWARKVFG